MRKRPQHWLPALLPKGDEAKLLKAGYVKDPTLGWTNTRDPWWLIVWMYTVLVIVLVLLIVGGLLYFNLLEL